MPLPEASRRRASGHGLGEAHRHGGKQVVQGLTPQNRHGGRQLTGTAAGRALQLQLHSLSPQVSELGILWLLSMEISSTHAASRAGREQAGAAPLDSDGQTLGPRRRLPCPRKEPVLGGGPAARLSRSPGLNRDPIAQATGPLGPARRQEPATRTMRCLAALSAIRCPCAGSGILPTR